MRAHLEVIQQSTGSRDQQVDTLRKLLCLCLSVGSSHDDRKSLVVVLAKFLGDTENLKRELSSRGNDDRTSSCANRSLPCQSLPSHSHRR